MDIEIEPNDPEETSSGSDEESDSEEKRVRVKTSC